MKNTKTSMFIRKARKRFGLTQKGFAKKLGTTRCAIANYETGRSAVPGDVVLRIQELDNQLNQSV